MKGNKRKFLQISTLFFNLSNGQAMTDYEKTGPFLKKNGMPNMPKGHWGDNSGWELTEAMGQVFKTSAAAEIEFVNFFTMTMDEVTMTVSKSHMMGIHLYYVKDWVRVVVFVGLAEIKKSPNAPYLVKIALKTLKDNLNMDLQRLGEACVGATMDGASVLQGEKSGFIVRLQANVAPFMQGMHCAAHKTQLAATCLTEVKVVESFTHVMKTMNRFFNKGGKRWNKIQVTAEGLGLKKPKRVLRCIETQWLGLVKPMERISSMYGLLALEVSDEVYKAEPAAISMLSTLLDVDVVLGHLLLLPLLKELNYLVKLLQKKEVYVGDVKEGVISAIEGITANYLVAATKFKPKQFKDLDKWKNNAATPMKWEHDAEEGEAVLVLKCTKEAQSVPLHVRTSDGLVGRPRSRMVTRTRYLAAATRGEEAAVEAAHKVLAAIRERFPPVPVMDSLELIYPQTWCRTIPPSPE